MTRRFLSDARSIRRSFLGIASSSYWKNTPSVFVLSTGRTGTQTLQALLELAPSVDAYHEPNPQLLKERQAARTEVFLDRKKYERIFSKSRGEALMLSRLKNRTYAETSPRMTFFAPVISELLPSSRFVFLHRNPADVVRSGMRRGWYVDHPADRTRHCPVRGEQHYSEWNSWDPFQKICWYWATCNQFALDFIETIDPTRVMTLSSTEMFAGTEIDQLFGFIGHSTPSNDNLVGVLDQKMNAQTSSVYPHPELWTHDQWRTMESLAGSTMATLGYQTPATDIVS